MEVFVRVNFCLIFCFLLTFVLAFSGDTEEGSHSVEDLDKLIEEDNKGKDTLRVGKSKGMTNIIVSD